MAISRLLAGAHFDPEVVAAMSAALEEVCLALHVPAAATGARGIIARRLIMLARNGERSSKSMVEAVLRETGIRGT